MNFQINNMRKVAQYLKKEGIRHHPTYLKNISVWTAAFLVGLMAVGYASCFSYLENIPKQILATHPYLLLVFTPFCFVVAWALVYFLAPEAKGSGIPQVMSAIELSSNETDLKKNQAYIEKLIGIKVIVIKVLSSLICVIGGGAVGREGPTIQIAVGIFHFIGKKTKKFTKASQHSFLFITGGAAGIAAAFNTPLGGLVYGIEELATSHFNNFKKSLISSVIIAGLAAQWILGPYLYIGKFHQKSFSFHSFPWVILVGLITGLAGALFSKILFKFSYKFSNMYDVKSNFYLALILGFLIAAIAIFIDSNSIGSGREVLMEMIFNGEGHGDIKLTISRFIAPILTYLSGSSGGIFAPSLAAGGTIGSLVAHLTHGLDKNIFILIGMTGFLTGVTQAPFTSFVLIMEMSDDHTLIFPLMLSALTALFFAHFVDSHSFYEKQRDLYRQRWEDETKY